jgi:hypothetical protein
LEVVHKPTFFVCVFITLVKQSKLGKNQIWYFFGGIDNKAPAGAGALFALEKTFIAAFR